MIRCSWMPSIRHWQPLPNDTVRNRFGRMLRPDWPGSLRGEQEVLVQVVAGLANKQIAARLGTTEQTIKVHRGRVMAKMQAESLPDLVLLAQLAGVIPTPS